jgi:hypothetical protein
MLVSLDEIEEVYLWNSASTVQSLCVDFLLYTEFLTLNRVGIGLATETGAGTAGRAGGPSDVDDFLSRYRRICKS